MLPSSPKTLALSLAAFLATTVLPGLCFGQRLQLDALKANYLQGFADFAVWTEQDPKPSKVIGILGAPEFARQLDEKLRTSSSPHFVKPISPANLENAMSVDLLFVPAGHQGKWPRLVEIARAHRLLLVGEEVGFRERGGAIELLVRKNRLRFAIDPENARRCGIILSSKLVELAIDER